MKRVLVTGVAGLLGSNVLQALKGHYDVVGTYNRVVYEPPAFRTIRMDVTDEASVRRAFAEAQPEAVIHCAAETRVDWCEDHADEAARINVEGTRLVAEATKQRGGRIILISTDGVFDGRRGPYGEDSPLHPVNVYSRTKLASEDCVRSLSDSLIARCTMYGWNAQSKASLAEWALERLHRGEKTPGFADALFSPVPANDLAVILREMLDRNLVGLYHVGSRDRCSKFEFLSRLARIFGYDPSLVYPTALAQASLRAPRPLDTSLKVGKIARSLGRPMPTVGEGLEHFRSAHASGYVSSLRIGIGTEAMQDATN